MHSTAASLLVSSVNCYKIDKPWVDDSAPLPHNQWHLWALAWIPAPHPPSTSDHPHFHHAAWWYHQRLYAATQQACAVHHKLYASTWGTQQQFSADVSAAAFAKSSSTAAADAGTFIFKSIASVVNALGRACRLSHCSDPCCLGFIDPFGCWKSGLWSLYSAGSSGSGIAGFAFLGSVAAGSGSGCRLLLLVAIGYYFL